MYSPWFYIGAIAAAGPMGRFVDHTGISLDGGTLPIARLVTAVWVRFKPNNLYGCLNKIIIHVLND